MAQVPVGRKLDPDEFLAWERAQEGRHHYVRGEIFAMAGGSPRHNHLAARVLAGLGRGTEGKACRAFTSDQRLGLVGDEFVYADAVVVCGPLELRPGTSDVLTNPTVVIEVLSKSTEAYDRGDKQSGYLALASLRHFVLVSQRERRVELYTRQDDGSFRFDVLGGAATLNLDRIGVAITLDEIYGDAFELPGE